MILGKNDLRYYEPDSKVVKVHKIIMNPAYHYKSLENDIALLKIDKVNFSQYIQPICLPDPKHEYANIKTTCK